ncbi:arginine--tRNA ligase [Candidatus Bathyarchaeota archaeon]|nr:arginine--tRNA ligase [Candidatus Bathyarchaeota archaeon]
MSNPLSQLKAECRRLLEEALKGLYPDIELPEDRLSRPPTIEMGELSSSLCLQLGPRIGLNPIDLARRVAKEINAASKRLVASAEEKNGYINFQADTRNFSKLVLEAATGDEEYGFLKTDSPERVMVEHTSANPIRPLHIGTARNSVLGDALARIQRKRGHSVEVHFYVDDMGRQVATATYGWRLLGKPEPSGRADEWFGEIYAIVNVLKEVKRLKRELEEAKERGDDERVWRINRELDKYASAANELRERSPLFDELNERMKSEPDPEKGIMELNTEYEKGAPEAKRDVRRLVEHCVRGFEEVLGELDIRFDFWDYEGDLVWSGAVEEAIEALRRTPYTSYEDGALILDCEAVARALGLKERWGINPSYEIPRLVLMRADGTTLYTPRDIAYSIQKFRRVDRVINVIGCDQSLAQLQLRIALAAMGKLELADRQIHYAYEFVRLPEVKMSGRLGRYVTLRELLERAVSLAYEEVSKRSPNLTEDEMRSIARMVGHGAVKYTLLSLDPMKVVVFDWNKALNFEMNSAPFIQYSHARACNILKRAPSRPEPDYSLLNDARERELVLLIAQFPEVFLEACESLKPSGISSYANTLADRFNAFYAALPVIKAEPPGLAGARLMLVDSVRIVLRNALSVLGIEAPERM